MTPSVDELRALNWQSLVEESTSRSCDMLHQTLSRWFRESTIEPRVKGVWQSVEPILALYLHFDPDSQRPYQPVPLLDGLDIDLLRAFSGMVDEVGSADLRARVLDLAWLVRVCDHSRVRAAVEAYISSADEQIDLQNSLHAHTRLQRAMEIAAAMGTNQLLFSETVAAVEERIDRLGVTDALYLTARLMKILLRFRTGDAARYAPLSNAIARRAREAYEASGVGNGIACEREREYLETELAWRRQLGDETAVRSLNLEIAEAFVRQADGVIAANWPNCRSIATHFIGSAITRLRQVGGEVSRVDELRLKQQALQRESVADMRSMNVSIDLTEAVKAAKAHVTGKPPIAALVALAFCHEPPRLADLEEEVRQEARKSPFFAMVSHSYLGPRGTVLAEHAGVINQDDATGFRLETMRVAHVRQSLVAISLIHVAAEQIRAEHGLDTPWFFGLARSSAFVPAHRERSFARGLSAGLRGDYELAAVILCPQFEHAVREVFFRQGIVTSTLPSSGAQNEHNLNQLLEHPRAIEIFGKELLFDLRVLLTEKAGANLRNDIAHGILDDDDKGGAKIYFWWMCMRLVLLPVLKGADVPRAAAEEPPPSKEADR